MLFCGTCHPEKVAQLYIGQTYALRCPKCCKHDKGTWILTEGFMGYREGFKSEACLAGCGTILKEEQLLG